MLLNKVHICSIVAEIVAKYMGEYLRAYITGVAFYSYLRAEKSAEFGGG
jgi:hypothetical protein